MTSDHQIQVPFGVPVHKSSSVKNFLFFFKFCITFNLINFYLVFLITIHSWYKFLN